MKQLLTFLAIIFLFHPSVAQEKFNLDFEKKSNARDLPDGWFKWGNYELCTDEIAHSGKFSGKVSSSEYGESFGSIAYMIPARYKGTNIVLEGYIKTKDVHNGFAGLLLRVDGSNGSLAFDNMQQNGVKGTTDWEKYRILLSYPEAAEKIYVAGILVGSGEAWFDDFKLTIDGQDVQLLGEWEEEVFPAELDTAYDNGSGITLPELSKEKISDLELLGKVWGFLKYHHQHIGSGLFNWDYELFRFLPSYLSSNRPKEKNQLLLNWIDSLGKLQRCKNCIKANDEAFLKPDHRWMEYLEPKLRRKLQDVYDNRSSDNQYYIRLVPSVGNPQFRHESAHASMNYPDAGFRLLSLYRYWNMIQYFFPYRHLIDKDWSTVLAEYISVFLNAEDELAYELAVLRLIGDIQDTHANIWQGADKVDEWKGQYYSPIHVQFIENKLAVTDYYNPKMNRR